MNAVCIYIPTAANLRRITSFGARFSRVYQPETIVYPFRDLKFDHELKIYLDYRKKRIQLNRSTERSIHLCTLLLTTFSSDHSCSMENAKKACLCWRERGQVHWTRVLLVWLHGELGTIRAARLFTRYCYVSRSVQVKAHGIS